MLNLIGLSAPGAAKKDLVRRLITAADLKRMTARMERPESLRNDTPVELTGCG